MLRNSHPAVASALAASDPHDAATARVEQPHLLEFQAFYERLADRRDVFYMFFTSGLLHWTLSSLRFVPPEVNVVLIGANLIPEELQWIANHVSRHFHHVRLAADDKTIWELLWQTNRHHFGWLDIDCFVLNPELFQAMKRIEPDVIANGCWPFTPRPGIDVLLTYFLFLNVDVIRKVTAALPVSPCTYSYHESRSGRTAPYGFCRRVTPAITAALASLLPTGSEGHPVYLTETDCYDTLQVYQLVAQSLGHRIGRVRQLRRQMSNEIVHVGRVSYYSWGWAKRTLPSRQADYRLRVQADYLILRPLVERLPGGYVQRCDDLRSELRRLGLPTSWDGARATIRQVLAANGVGDEAVDRIAGHDETSGP